MPTIRDVAKMAGVAPMTVSRVINKSGYVSDETRTKVEAAIKELGYVPNMLGHSLRFKQTNTLALVLTDITNPFWTTVARGVEDAAQKNEFNVILCNTDESISKQEQYLTMLLKRRIDGILLVPTSRDPKAVEQIQKQGISVIVLDRGVCNVAVDVVRGDSVGGASQLTQHLIGLGHQHIAMLTGPKDVSTAIDRVDGYKQAMHEANLAQNHVYWGTFSSPSGYEMTKRALADDPKITAILAANNFIAIGTLQAIREAGLKVPDDISVVSFGDIPPDINPDPFLTVVTHPTYEMGYQATLKLLTRISEENSTDFEEFILPTEVTVRRSSGPAPLK
ncbi:MAG: LacI family transcriptional regulator [Chloroflexi bacterium]|nr:MAG: LacI family transcriptional regulator [Chloroflexota bacterium]